MTQHTQGEWIGAVAGSIIDIGTENTQVCVINFSGNPTDEQKANARLIAAAPKLLKALEYARNHVVNPENTDTTDLLKVLNAAIAAATTARPDNTKG